MQDLRAIADAIPELGHGGRTMADRLIDLACAVPSGRAIVDVAPWLGSTSSYLALGILKAGSGNCLHAFDRWRIDEEYRRKAKKYHGLDLKIGQSIRSRWVAHMAPFGIRAVPHQVDVLRMTWDDGPVGLLVDDISNTADMIRHTMLTFGPWMVPGAHLVLMDWGFNERRGHPHQRRLMERNASAFKMTERLPRPSEAAVFVRLGGKVVE